MPSYPYALTLTNPGAETGDLTGWTVDTGALSAAVSANARTGTHAFYPGATASFTAHQDVTLPSDVLSDVDAGLVRVEAAAWQWDTISGTDSAYIGIECLDGSSTVLASATSTPISDAQQVWMQRSLNLPVPDGTRTIRYKLGGTRTGGSTLDCLFDDLTLQLTSEPDTLDLSTLAGTSDLDLLLRPRGAIWEVDSRDGNRRVIKWLDESGNAAHFTASGTQRPQYYDDAGAGLNSVPAVAGDGSIKQMAGSGSALAYSGNAGLTVFALVHPNTAVQ